MIELERDNLSQILDSNSKVMIMYGAPWCGNCRITKPKFKRLAAENEDITFVYVNAEAFPQSRNFAEVSNLPTFAAINNHHFLGQNTGNKIEVINEVLNKLK
jgi:thiol-disulfide isomerase/thioredoxin